MITFNEYGQIRFDASDIEAAFHSGEADFVFLRGEPDKYGYKPCLKRWDDPFSSRPNWFFCYEVGENFAAFDEEIASRAFQQAQGVFHKQGYEGF